MGRYFWFFLFDFYGLLRDIITSARPIHQPKGEFKMDNKVLQIIVALFIPPLAVYMKTGKIDNDFWINVIATLLGGLPGVIHALWVILR
jgi:uncharacterized membrane protein YqaE (UPF0057 family)